MCEFVTRISLDYFISLFIFVPLGGAHPGQYPGQPGSPVTPSSPFSPYSPNSPSRTLPRNFKSYHEASGIHTLIDQASRHSISGGSSTLPRNYKSPSTSPLGSPTEPLIDLPVSCCTGQCLLSLVFGTSFKDRSYLSGSR